MTNDSLIKKIRKAREGLDIDVCHGLDLAAQIATEHFDTLIDHLKRHKSKWDSEDYCRGIDDAIEVIMGEGSIRKDCEQAGNSPSVLSPLPPDEVLQDAIDFVEMHKAPDQPDEWLSIERAFRFGFGAGRNHVNEESSEWIAYKTDTEVARAVFGPANKFTTDKVFKNV